MMHISVLSNIWGPDWRGKAAACIQNTFVLSCQFSQISSVMTVSTRFTTQLTYIEIRTFCTHKNVMFSRIAVTTSVRTPLPDTRWVLCDIAVIGAAVTTVVDIHTMTSWGCQRSRLRHSDGRRHIRDSITVRHAGTFSNQRRTACIRQHSGHRVFRQCHVWFSEWVQQRRTIQAVWLLDVITIATHGLRTCWYLWDTAGHDLPRRHWTGNRSSHRNTWQHCVLFVDHWVSILSTSPRLASLVVTPMLAWALSLEMYITAMVQWLAIMVLAWKFNFQWNKSVFLLKDIPWIHGILTCQRGYHVHQHTR